MSYYLPIFLILFLIRNCFTFYFNSFRIYDELSKESVKYRLTMKSWKTPYYFGITFLIIPPILEEIIFRFVLGYIFGISDIAILFRCLIFSLVHYLNKYYEKDLGIKLSHKLTIYHCFCAFTTGIALEYIYWNYGILIAILIHFLNNINCMSLISIIYLRDYLSSTIIIDNNFNHLEMDWQDEKSYNIIQDLFKNKMILS